MPSLQCYSVGKPILHGAPPPAPAHTRCPLNPERGVTGSLRAQRTLCTGIAPPSRGQSRPPLHTCLATQVCAQSRGEGGGSWWRTQKEVKPLCPRTCREGVRPQHQYPEHGGTTAVRSPGSVSWGHVTGDLQQKAILAQFWGPEVLNPGVTGLCSLRRSQGRVPPASLSSWWLRRAWTGNHPPALGLNAYRLLWEVLPVSCR